jgi:hypothetical protein
MARKQGERWNCEACGEALVGALTINGKVAPVEVLDKPNGNVWLGRRSTPEGPDFTEVRCATLSGPLLEKAREAGISLHLNHFAYCPERERFARS